MEEVKEYIPYKNAIFNIICTLVLSNLLFHSTDLGQSRHGFLLAISQYSTFLGSVFLVI